MFFTQRDTIGIGVAMPVLATVAIAARLFVRRRKGTSLGADDYTILAALILVWGCGCALINGAAQGALGVHTGIDPVTGEDIITPAALIIPKTEYAFTLIFILAIGMIKISVLLLYRRVFISEGFKKASMAMLVLITTWCIAFFFARAFSCGLHFDAQWTDGAAITQYCGPYRYVELGFGVSDVVTDLMVLALPIRYVWKLQMQTSQKVAISGIFLLGLLSTAAGAIRLAFLVLDGYEPQIGYRDVSAGSTIIQCWAEVEAGIAILAACLPTLKSLFNGASPESIINSIRSVFSLRSFGSDRARQGERERRESDREDLTATAASPAKNVRLKGSNRRIPNSDPTASFPGILPPLPASPRPHNSIAMISAPNDEEKDLKEKVHNEL